VVEAKKIELLMCASELAVRLEKREIACDGLIQQVDRLQQIRFQATAKTKLEKIPGAIVQIERNEVSCWRLFNDELLRSRNFRTKLLSDFSRKVALDRKQVIQIAVEFFRPDERSSTGL
jgi:hypothetical protein